MAKIKTNGSQFKNPDLSGALHTLRIQYSYIQTQCEDGARDVRVLKLTPVVSKSGKPAPPHRDPVSQEKDVLFNI